jgi:hypothetical protein
MPDRKMRLRWLPPVHRPLLVTVVVSEVRIQQQAEMAAEILVQRKQRQEVVVHPIPRLP